MMLDRGLFLSLHAIRRQLAAMPQDLYLVRLLHHETRSAFPGERLWTAAQLGQEATVRFLRIRNREGCDVYVHPFGENRNTGYILLDLDHTDAAAALEQMRSNGHQPCVVLQTSPGHLQAWIRVSTVRLEPAIATAIARQLAHSYGGDLASADWRHLGRLAGFTNQKPLRRQSNGYPPWVRVLHAQLTVASNGAALVQAAERQTRCDASAGTRTACLQQPLVTQPVVLTSTPAEASRIYQSWLQRLWIPHRFPHPDWSIADKWIAKELLRRGMPFAAVAHLLRCGSPGFPRHHADPENYLHRTIARALGELADRPFPAPARGARCVHDV
jgi:DNA primase RepB-like protein